MTTKGVAVLCGVTVEAELYMTLAAADATARVTVASRADWPV
jgi:hypothetical protein